MSDNGVSDVRRMKGNWYELSQDGSTTTSDPTSTRPVSQLNEDVVPTQEGPILTSQAAEVMDTTEPSNDGPGMTTMEPSEDGPSTSSGKKTRKEKFESLNADQKTLFRQKEAERNRMRRRRKRVTNGLMKMKVVDNEPPRQSAPSTASAAGTLGTPQKRALSTSTTPSPAVNVAKKFKNDDGNATHRPSSSLSYADAAKRGLTVVVTGSSGDGLAHADVQHLQEQVVDISLDIPDRFGPAPLFKTTSVRDGNLMLECGSETVCNKVIQWINEEATPRLQGTTLKAVHIKEFEAPQRFKTWVTDMKCAKEPQRLARGLVVFNPEIKTIDVRSVRCLAQKEGAVLMGGTMNSSLMKHVKANKSSLLYGFGAINFEFELKEDHKEGTAPKSKDIGVDMPSGTTEEEQGTTKHHGE